MKFIKLTILVENLNEKGKKREKEELATYVKEMYNVEPMEKDTDDDLDDIEKALRESAKIYGGSEPRNDKQKSLTVEVHGFIFEPEDDEVDVLGWDYLLPLDNIEDIQAEEQFTYVEKKNGQIIKVDETIEQIEKLIREINK